MVGRSRPAPLVVVALVLATVLVVAQPLRTGAQPDPGTNATPSPTASPVPIPDATRTPASATPAAQPSPAPSQPPMPSAPVATSTPAGTGAHRFSGALSIEGRSAPPGTLVSALVGDRTCASTRTAQLGRYSMSVPLASAAGGCGRPGTQIRFAVTPAFGDGWREDDTVTFEAGGNTQHDLAIDLRRLPPHPENVPLNGVTWENPLDMRIGVCAQISRESAVAVTAAARQWRTANEEDGLVIALTPDGSAACGETAPGIAIVEDDIDDPNIIAGTVPVDANLDPVRCDEDAPCAVFKAAIVINYPTLLRLTTADRANVIAHEIGHALGLGHAYGCDGGTIMWRDTECRYPLTHIGVDDIARLNAKVSPEPGTEPMPAPAEPPAPGADGVDDETMTAALRSPESFIGRIHSLASALRASDASRLVSSR